VCLPALWERKVGFWACSDLTFGLNLTAAAAFAGEELSCLPQIEVLPADALLAEERLVWEADLRQVSSRELQHVTNDALEFNISASAPQTGSGSASQTAQTEAASGGGAADVTGVGGSKRLALHGIALWFAVGGPSASSSASTHAPRTPRRQKRPLGVAGDGPHTHAHTHTQTDAEAHTYTHGQAHTHTHTHTSLLATGPMDPETHWKQTTIARPHPLPLRADVTRLHCGLSLRRAEHRQVASRFYKLVAQGLMHYR
jgi:hypothetical protein